MWNCVHSIFKINTTVSDLSLTKFRSKQLKKMLFYKFTPKITHLSQNYFFFEKSKNWKCVGGHIWRHTIAHFKALTSLSLYNLFIFDFNDLVALYSWFSKIFDVAPMRHQVVTTQKLIYFWIRRSKRFKMSYQAVKLITTYAF